jgi:hypothetical protein
MEDCRERSLKHLFLTEGYEDHVSKSFRLPIRYRHIFSESDVAADPLNAPENDEGRDAKND